MTRDGVELDPLRQTAGPLRASRPGSANGNGAQGRQRRIMRGPFPDDWQDLAKCKGEPTEKWYPEGEEPDRPALVICFRCPVRRECATHALGLDGANGQARAPETSGIWGASSWYQRAQVLRAVRNGLVPREEAVDVLMDLTDAAGRRRRLI